MFDSKEYRQKMQSVVARFEEGLKKVRTGRAHPDMLSGIKVEAYGQLTPLAHVANVTVADATMLTVTPFDPGNLAAISAAIRLDQTLGFNPSDDGRMIRVPVPPLTEERRREIVKGVGTEVENAKIALRNVREDARRELKTAELPEDTVKRGEKEIDELIKEFSDQIDAKFKEKETEIMKI